MATESKRLYRSRSNRMVGGVAAGVGEYFNIDPTLIRLLFVLGTFLGGPGLLIYIVMLILVPDEPLSQTVTEMSVEPTDSSEESVE